MRLSTAVGRVFGSRGGQANHAIAAMHDVIQGEYGELTLPK